MILSFYDVISLVIEANKLGILDDIDITKENERISWYYGGLKSGKLSNRIYFEDGKVSYISKKELESLKRRVKRARDNKQS